MRYSLILDMDDEILNKDYSPDFRKEYGIINMNNLGPGPIGGLFEMEIFFDNQESKERFIKDLDID